MSPERHSMWVKARLPDTVDAHLARSGGVKDLVHHLDLRVVVPGAQRAHLPPRQSVEQCTLLRTIA